MQCCAAMNALWYCEAAKMAVMVVVGRFEEHLWCFGLFGRSGAYVAEQARASVARCSVSHIHLLSSENSLQ